MFCRTVGNCAVRLTCLTLCCWVTACEVASRADYESSIPASYGGSPRLGNVNVDGAQSVTFDNLTSPIVVPVLSQVQLEVHVSPASNQTVAFAIIGTGLDAALETAQVVTDALGHAANTLTTSSSPTTFSVRASLDQKTTAEIPISVVGAMTGSLDVSVKYTGTRQVRFYYITVYPGKDCTSPNLGDVGQSRIDAPPTTTLPSRIEAVPLDKSFAVVVSGDNAIRGCATAHNVPGQATLAVEVPINDLPLNLYDTALELDLSAVEGLDTFRSGLSNWVPTFVDSLVIEDNDLLDLLVTMQSTAIGSLQDEFITLRTTSRWDDEVLSEYATVGGDRLLRRQLGEWAYRAVGQLSSQPTFRVRLTLGPNDYTSPYLSLLSVAGVDASASKLMRDSTLALDPEPNDLLNWSSTLTWTNSWLLDLLAFAAASVDHPGSSGIAALLAQTVDCDRFAAVLDAHAVWTTSGVRSCTVDCLAELCRSAIDAMYARTQRPNANSSSVQDQSKLSFSASGPIAVDGNAMPLSMQGTWTGILVSESGTSDLAGNYRGP